MTAPLNVDTTQQATVTGYQSRPVTKPPNWHGLVTLDLLLNNLSTGLFLVAAIGELVHPAVFGPLVRVAYPIALLWLVGDLVCLVLDLGDPARFHHMLRVWKPSSPMSLGTWALSAYAGPLTLLAALSLLPAGSWDGLRRIIAVVGLAPGLAAAAYKGVLFSTTAQRGWQDARWFGGYLLNSALVLGAGELLLLALAMGPAEAVSPLRLALGLLLGLNLVALVLLLADLRGPLSDAGGPRRFGLIAVIASVGGILLPLGLLALGTPSALTVAVVLMLVGAAIVRDEVVRLPTPELPLPRAVTRTSAIAGSPPGVHRSGEERGINELHPDNCRTDPGAGRRERLRLRCGPARPHGPPRR
jgi:hypothetical protein